MREAARPKGARCSLRGRSCYSQFSTRTGNVSPKLQTFVRVKLVSESKINALGRV